jgi:predicted membrane-bound spermidine synthase
MQIVKRSKEMIKKGYLEGIVGINGALIMIYEIIGARVVAPYFGSTTYVWTAVIGVFMAALALGYWQGGQLADKKPHIHTLGRIFIVGGMTLMVTTSVQKPTLTYIVTNIPNLRAQAVLAALLLFAPATYFAGMTSPYVAKLKTASLKTSGATVGKIYAFGTFGSIVGTFLAGFWLTDTFGNRSIEYTLAMILLLMGICIVSIPKKKLAVMLVSVLMVLLQRLPANVFYDAIYETDTTYSHYAVRDAQWNGKNIRILSTDRFGAQSGVLLDNPSAPAFDYIAQMVAAARYMPHGGQYLLLGGGTYTLATQIILNDPTAHIDVVEIDPALDTIARQYFGYRPNDHITILHDDARRYVNENTKQYNLIFVDVYNSLLPPFHLSTKEMAEQLKQSLTPNGAVIANVVADNGGPRQDYLASIVATYATALPHTTVSQATPRHPEIMTQNFIVTASASQQTGELLHKAITSPIITPVGIGSILSDDFAPTEKLIGGI